MKADDFLKVGEKYFYIYIPSVMLNGLYNLKVQITVTSITRIDNEVYTEFTLNFKGGNGLNYRSIIYDTNVFEDYAYIEDGCYGTIITKYDKSSARKAIMKLAYRELNRISPIAKEKRTILRNNVKYILEEIKKFKL